MQVALQILHVDIETHSDLVLEPSLLGARDRNSLHRVNNKSRWLRIFRQPPITAAGGKQGGDE